MKFDRISACVALSVSLAGAATAQPYSESMADCAATYQNAAQWVKTDERAEKLMVAARAWHEAAVSQSQAEGRPLSDAQMWDKIDDKTDALEAKGALWAFSQEFRDWASYCRKFGKHTGVKVSF